MSLHSVGVSMPSAECRRWRLWKISRYSNIAFASSTRVRQRRQQRITSECLKVCPDQSLNFSLIQIGTGTETGEGCEGCQDSVAQA